MAKTRVVSLWVMLLLFNPTFAQEKVNNLENEAQKLFAGNKYKEVTQLIWKNIDKAQRPTLILLIKSHETLSEPESVLKAVRILLNQNPKDTDAYVYQGRAYLAQRKSNSPTANKKLETTALESLKKALEIDSKFLPAYMEISQIYDKKEKPNFYELRLLYEDMIQKMGEKYEFFAKLCQIETLDGVNQPAIRACSKAIQLKPHDIQSSIYLGKAYRQSGESEKGLQVMKKTAEQNSKSEFANEHYAKALEEDKNYLQAFKVYEFCTTANSKNIECLLGAGRTGSQIQQYEKSIQSLERACNLERKNAVQLRRVAGDLRNAKELEWSSQFEKAAQRCLGQ